MLPFVNQENECNLHHGEIEFEKCIVFSQNCDQRQELKEVIDDKAGVTTKYVRISTCAVQDDVLKIKKKHLVFKASVAEIKTRVLIDNGSKAKLIDEFFVRLHRISTFRLTKKIKLELGNGDLMQWLDKACLVDMYVGNHYKQLLCYMSKFNVYSMVLRDG